MEIRLENKNTYDDDFEIDDIGTLDPVRIVVIGVGGGGGNAIVHMAEVGINNVEYVAANTDVDALRKIDASKITRIQIGKKCAKGRGAGNNPKMGKDSAEEAREKITDYISKGPDNRPADMVFVSAGMGGGTGTGAAPVVAGIAKELGVLTVGVVTKPFMFEREAKMRQAMSGIEEMRKVVDALVVVPNEKINEINNGKLTFRNGFKEVDDVLCRAVKGIVDIVHDNSYMNVDFADVCTILRDSGIAHMAVGHGHGENRVEEAFKEVIDCPLLETSISGARRVLVNLILPLDASFDIGNQIVDSVTKCAADDVNVVLGVAFNEDLAEDELSITVIATDFEPKKEDKPAVPANAQAVPAQQQAAPVQQPAPRPRPTQSAGPEFIYQDNNSILREGRQPASSQQEVSAAEAPRPAQPAPERGYTSRSNDDVNNIISLLHGGKGGDK